MRESNYSFPPQNRAVVTITQLVYDRRALDTCSILAILNNLTSLTYLTSTSPRIREVLTLDGGLERLLDIIRQSTLPRPHHPQLDLWGLNGPPTAKVIPNDRALQLRHSLAFQCVVNIGVRGSEPIRTRVVQAGTLDLVAQILESWLKQHGVSIFAGPLGSQMAVDIQAAYRPPVSLDQPPRVTRHNTARPSTSSRPSVLAQFVANFTNRSRQPEAPARNDTDVDMADGEQDTEDGASVGPEDAMEVDEPRAGPSTTPRARQAMLPLPISIPPRTSSRDTPSQNSSAGNSYSEDVIPRTASVNSFASGSSTAAEIPRMRVPISGQQPASNQSSPTGTPTRTEMRERRNTLVGRPITVNLAPRNERRRETTAGSGTSDGGEDMDLPTATMDAARIAAGNQALVTGGVLTTGEDPIQPPRVAIVEDMPIEEQDPAEAAAEQLRMDLLAGAPPGQPGAAETPRAEPAAVPTRMEGQPAAQEQAQIIIANGAPRGFHDLVSYVGINQLLNPDADSYSEDSILLALQLLAYLSKYPHVRAAFHHPRKPMHPTFDLDAREVPLPQRPAYSETPDIFSLVERFTFRPSANDPQLFKIPLEVQYWAGVIMRNACRKDENRGGIRQCASMTCGKWESFAREFAKCRRCRKAKYCSKTCQSKAWGDGHRFWCNIKSEPEPGSASLPGGPPPPGGEDDDDDDNDDNDDGRGPRHRTIQRQAGQRHISRTEGITRQDPRQRELASDPINVGSVGRFTFPNYIPSPLETVSSSSTRQEPQTATSSLRRVERASDLLSLDPTTSSSTTLSPSMQIGRITNNNNSRPRGVSRSQHALLASQQYDPNHVEEIGGMDDLIGNQWGTRRGLSVGFGREE